MSESDHVLTVEAADVAAEISVFDGSSNQVGRDVGRFRQSLPPGIYDVRVRVGPSFQEHLVSLDRDRQIEVDTIEFASPIPLDDTSRSHEYHQQAASDASRRVRASFGSGASILVFAREWTGRGKGTGAGVSNPAAGLVFCNETGERSEIIADKADLRTDDGDASAGWRADVAPGAYRLKLEYSDGSGLERPLFATPGKQTQIFLLQRDQVLPDGKVERRADLVGATVTISPSQSFDREDRRGRLSELACYALAQSRRILGDQVMDELLDAKFEDPMLGLLGAHLLLHENPKGLSGKPDVQRKFDIVTDNLLKLLGPDHPDLRALWWKRSDGKQIGDGRLHALPMLRASWDLAVERSFQKPGAIALPSASNAAVVRLLSTAPWLLWRREDKDALSDAVGDYLSARNRAAASRASQSAARANPAASDDLASSLESLAPPRAAPTPPPLDHAEKVDIARTLGVPSEVLEGMLRKFSP